MKDFESLIKNYYRKYLRREPDDVGFNHYMTLLKKGDLNENSLKEIFLESEEYKRNQLVKNKKKSFIFKGKHEILYHIDPTSILDYNITKNKIWNEFLINYLKNVLSKNSIIFDIGANVGLATLSFSRILSPNGKIFSFEPNSHIRTKLLANIKLNKLDNVKVEKYALQENPLVSTSDFYIRRAIHDSGHYNYGISTLEKYPDYNIKKEIVQTTTIDRYVKENNISHIDFIKIDTEGADSRVLLGSKNTIKTNKPIIVYEYSTMFDRVANLENTKKSFHFLKNNNYTQFIIQAKNFSIIEEYNNKIPDADIICFPNQKIPIQMQNI